MLEELKGWRTIIFNVLVFVATVLDLAEFRDIIPADWMGAYALSVALVNLGLRYVTDTSVGQKE